MSIYENGDFFQCSKKIVRDKNISQSAKWLYVVLSCLNNQWGKKTGTFTRTNKELMNDCGMSAGTLKKAKKELVKGGYIKCWSNNLYSDDEHEKKTTFRICYYKILK